MIALTSGGKYSDIDLVSSCVAMQHLLSLQNIDSRIIVPKNFSSSIIPEMFSWFDADKIIEMKDYTYPEQEVYVFDISEQEFLSPNLDLKKITLLYDHHFGFEEQWKDYSIPKLKIEKIGACATQVYEEYCALNLQNKITTDIANLLYVTIITHTLNLKSAVATQRDIDASEALKPLTTITEKWLLHYYETLEKEIFQNPFEAVKNDRKIATIKGNQVSFGQIEMWNSMPFINSARSEIIKALEDANMKEYLFTSPNISQGETVAFTNSPRLEELLVNLMKFEKKGDLLICPKLYLRKEILKIVQ